MEVGALFRKPKFSAFNKIKTNKTNELYLHPPKWENLKWYATQIYDGMIADHFARISCFLLCDDKFGRGWGFYLKRKKNPD